MAQIQKVVPAEEAVNPELKIDVSLSLRRNRDLLLSWHGTLWCDEKKIGAVHGGSSDRTHRRLNINRSGGHRNDTVRLDLYSSLSRRALSYLEEQRDEHPHGDLTLKLKLNLRTAEFGISADDEVVLATDSGEALRGKLHRVGQQGSREIRVVSTDSAAEFLKVETREHTLNYKISSSDWTQKFCPALGIGHFLTFDYQVPGRLSSDGKGEEDLEERLSDAITSLSEMQNQIQAGEWNQAAQSIRGVAELIRKHEEDIASLLEQDEIEAEAATEITEGMHKLFGYASKFVHREDRSGELMPRSKASKEDAYLAYTIGVSVVNLISAKLRRTQATDVE